MAWYHIVSIAVAAAVFLYFIAGVAIAFGFLRRKPKTEEMSIAKERRYGITEEELFYRCEETSLKNRRGDRMFGRVYIADQKTDKWILVLHGYNSNGMSVRKYGKMFNDLGYNVVSPDFCFCGRSEGKFFSFGKYETEDAEVWLEWLKQKYHPVSLGVFGVSMGASTGIILASRHPEIDFLIPYCPYYSYKWEIIDTGNRMVKGKWFGLLYPAVYVGTYLAARGTKARLLCISDYLAKVTCPVLLLHSVQDDVTSYKQSVALQRENPHAELHLFEKGVHAKAYAADRQEYIGVVAEFLTKNDKQKNIA